MSREKTCQDDCCCAGTDTAIPEIAVTIDGADLVKSSFRIDGLDCADCATKLEKAIRKLTGVTEVQISFASALAKVVFDRNQIDVSKIVEVVKGFGYSASISKASQDSPGYHKSAFYVHGMDCADCAAKLEKVLGHVIGVRKATVNFAAGKLLVEHTISDNEIIEAVQQAGYQAVPEEVAAKQSKEAAPWWKKSKTIATVASGVILLAAATVDAIGVSESLAISLYLAAMVIGGYHVAKSGLYGLRSFTLDTNFLMAVAAIGAAVIGEWSEGATVVFLFSLGNALQAYTIDKTRNSIRALMELAPAEASVIRNGELVRLPVEQIVTGDIIQVKPGERIAMDGAVQQGLSAVNQAAITGESLPVEKKAGDTVYAGTLNEQGSLDIVVTRLAADSTLAKIMHMVEEAQSEKAPMQQFVDVFAKYYTPVVIFGAAALMFVPSLVFGQPFETWFYRALVLLVISCPCALVISTPVSIVSAIGNASRNGVLIKGGAYLEQLGRIKAIAFDKTGTLTMGKPIVTDIVPVASIGADEMLRVAASIESRSEHPLARAILAKAASMQLASVVNFKALVGRGAQADVDGKTVYVGTPRLFEELGQSFGSYTKILERLENEGKTTVGIGTANTFWGLIALADTIREDSAATIQSLRRAGIGQIVMLTGDNNRVASAIANTLELDAFQSELLPEDKVAAIKSIARSSGPVAMIGDGVNDAPALATADIGIAMGVAGSDTALETADIALMSDDLAKLPYVIKLSRKSVRIIKQNITFSLAVKLLFVAGTFLGFVNLWFAVFADTGASLIVTLNGLRLVREIK
jgi:Cd2+/Zn2+-exporting ATPase